MKKAFTLMEVLVVIGVLAILIGIAVPRIRGFQDEGNANATKLDLKILEAAIESYAMYHGQYPEGNVANIVSTLMDETPQVIKSLMYDRFGATPTTPYIYSVSTDRDYYSLSSVGLDRANGIAAIRDDGNVPVSADDYFATNGTAVDLDVQTDVDNCGSIGAAGGPDCCAGLPVDLQTDVANCGSCGNAGGPDCCAGLSVDLQTDEANCDTCGTLCSDTTDTCTAGLCKCGTGDACGADYVCEDGACLDTCLAAAAGPGTECADGTIYVSATLRTTPADAPGTYAWSTEEINNTGAMSLADGEDNTAYLAALLGVYPAADYCAGLDAHDHTDWYLPASDELNELWGASNWYCVTASGGEDSECLERASEPYVDGFGDYCYWSSSQNFTSTNVALCMWFNSESGDMGNRFKTEARSVRCVRTP